MLMALLTICSLFAFHLHAIRRWKVCCYVCDCLLTKLMNKLVRDSVNVCVCIRTPSTQQVDKLFFNSRSSHRERESIELWIFFGVIFAQTLFQLIAFLHKMSVISSWMYFKQLDLMDAVDRCRANGSPRKKQKWNNSDKNQFIRKCHNVSNNWVNEILNDTFLN